MSTPAMKFDHNEIGPASFFMQEIRSAHKTSQEQQNEHRSTSSNGVTSEPLKYLMLTSVSVPPAQHSGHGTPSAPLALQERIEVVSQKDTNVQGMTKVPLQDEVNASSLLEVVYQFPKYEINFKDETVARILNALLRKEIYQSSKYEINFKDETMARILNALRKEIYLSPKYQDMIVLNVETTVKPLNEPILAVSQKDPVGEDFNDEIVSSHETSNDDVQRSDVSAWYSQRHLIVVAGETARTRMITIDVLPVEILFEIFDIYRLNSPLGGRLWEWYTLAQVCKRWRSVLFASSRSLELKVFCTYNSPVREILSSSLDLPAIARYGGCPESNLLTAEDEDGIVALLDQPARLFELQLTATAPIMERMAISGLKRESFLALEYLRLSTRTEPELFLPSDFGGTPGLRTLWMVRVALPSFPRLLSLAQNLVSFQLEEIPSIGYTMEALLICLPSMTWLKTLRIHFLLPPFRPVLLMQSPERRPVLHHLQTGRSSLAFQNAHGMPDLENQFNDCLNYIDFHGTSEYLECLLATIDAPFLESIHITFFNQLIFHLPQLSQFIRRTETQQSPNQATIYYFGADISVTLYQAGMPHHLALRILCQELDWQISSMAEIFEAISPILSHVEQLNIGAPSVFRSGQDEIGLLQLDFPDLFGQFVNVKRLYITGESVSHVTVAMGQITGQLAITVLPELREIYVGNLTELASAQDGFEAFIAAREHSAHPVFICSLRAEPSQNFQPPLDNIHSPHTYPTQKAHPTLIPQLDVQGTLARLHSTNPHLLAILQMAGFSWSQLNIRPGQEPEANLFQKLAFTDTFGSEFPGQVAKTNFIPALVLRNGMVALYERLSMEWRWETFARMWAQSSTTAAYRNTLSSLRSLLAAGLTTPLLYTLGPLGQNLRIPLEYSSYLIERGQLELAIETIEHGKELIWSELSELHSSMGRLREVNPDLAERLAHLDQALKEINPSTSADHGGTDKFAIAVAFEELYTLLMGHQEVIQQIRALHGFANFMKAVPFRTLQTAAAQGPIIIVNHCRLRCDILIVLHDSPPSLIPTKEGFYERASNLASKLKESRQKHGIGSGNYHKVLASVLSELYELVGKPVIYRLRQLHIPEQTRIWWYPTSAFLSLPLHAMGPVPSDDGERRYFLDLYICSYTPTLRALILSRKSHSPKPNSQHSLLLVGQSDPFWPNTAGEIQVVQSLDISVTALINSQATHATVIESLQNHTATLVHLIGRSITESWEPLDTGIELFDHYRLTLRDVVNLRLRPAEFAFLSAGHTAMPTDGCDPTPEGLNIAAAMQCRGCGSVVGAMWDMVDEDEPDLAKHFYEALLESNHRNLGFPLGERSAKALQCAVKKIRKKKRITLGRWVNWVHYGA